MELYQFEELAALVEASQPDSMPWPDMEPEDGEEAMPEPEATEPAGAEEALRDLSALFARNGDCIGWLSIALVIFTVWRPNWAILGSIVFSMLYLLPAYFGDSSHPEQAAAITMLPYLVTIVVLVITSIVSRRESQPPASLGLSYFREER